MKLRIMMLMLAMSFGISTLAAQNNRRPASAEDMAKNQTERVAERLHLNAEQRDRVHSVYLKYARQMPAQGERRDGESSETREQRRKEMERMQSERDIEIKAILTAQQQALYDEMLKEARGRRGQRP